MPAHHQQVRVKERKKPTDSFESVGFAFFATPEGEAKKNSGSDLLSHKVTLAVPLAQRSLTTEFGKGSGVTSSL